MGGKRSARHDACARGAGGGGANCSPTPPPQRCSLHQVITSLIEHQFSHESCWLVSPSAGVGDQGPVAGDNIWVYLRKVGELSDIQRAPQLSSDLTKGVFTVPNRW